jgi:chromosome segregation protein
MLEEALEQQPKLEQERQEAQQQVNAETAANAQLEARLNALRQLQERVQTQGKVTPWLQKHELESLPRLWQKLNIEAGWEPALESVLRERTSALQMSNIEWAKAFFSDAPPAKLALYAPSTAVPPAPVEVAGLKPFLNLLKMNDPGLRGLLQDWLHNVYTADDTAEALPTAPSCRPALHRHAPGPRRHAGQRALLRRRFEQDGMLGRQQEIDNITKQLRAADAGRRSARALGARRSRRQ